MRQYRAIAQAAVIGAVLMMTDVPAVLLAAPLVHASARTSQAACAAAGTYFVGPRIIPGVQRSGRRAAPIGGQRATAAAPSVAQLYPFWGLRGQVVIASYGPCGTPTSGTFSVRRLPVGPPVERVTGTGQQPMRGSAIACALPCWPPTGVAQATGRFVADPAHPDDPLYVRVDATITSTRAAPSMGRPCSTARGCPPATVITSTVTFVGVTGYLQVAGTATAGTATLSFLPPPTRTDLASPQALTLIGWRGAGLAPLPQ
ncbi:MAG: hypothetical protein NVSMB65_04640 [Chloroflexota bacterium]